MGKKIKNIFVLICLVGILILPYFVFAQTRPLDKLREVGEDGGYAGVESGAGGNNLAANAGRIVNVFFSLLGIIFLVLMLYAGFNWMTAAGDQAKVTKAQDTIKRAIIGLVITVGAYAITNFVLYNLLKPNGN